MTAPSSATASLEELAADLLDRGVRRVHVLAWRDLDDEDAGGSELHADEFMRRWAQAGLDITQRTSAARGLPATAERSGYRVVRRGSRYTVFPRVIAAEAATRRFDALVEVWNGVPWMTPLWCRRPRVTFLHHVHGPMWDQILPAPIARAGRLLEERVAPPFYRRTQMLTPSEATRQELLALGFRPDRVRTVLNGVDPEFRPGGVRSPVPLVVGVGRLAPVKRHVELVDAAVQAKARVPDLELVVVGDGPMRPAIEARIAGHGAGGWIRLAGRLGRAELTELYQRAWLVSSASVSEGWGLTITEAAACGTPAVATDISGHRSSVVDGVTGVLAPLERLGETIADVLLDHPRRQRLADAALARARTFTWDESARGVLAALHGEVARRRAR